MENNIKIANCGCGGNGKVLKINEKSYFITCSNCHTDSGIYSTEAEAIEAWNKAMGERTAKVKWASTYGEIMEYRFEGICECGTEIDHMWEYCPSCGARLE